MGVGDGDGTCHSHFVKSTFYLSSRITLQALYEILLLWHVERSGRIMRYSKQF